MAEALAGKSLKRKFTVMTSVLGRDGRILGTSSQEDSAEHEVEVDACDEEVLQQAQDEWPACLAPADRAQVGA